MTPVNHKSLHDMPDLTPEEIQNKRDAEDAAARIETARLIQTYASHRPEPERSEVMELAKKYT